MKDETEGIRKVLVKEINSTKDTEREDFELRYGKVWNTQELSEEFTVSGFMAPYVMVKRKLDDTKGTMMFSHSPRYYFCFEPV